MTDQLRTLGQVAYDAFVDQLHAAHGTTRHPTESGWDHIGDTVRRMWEAAGVAAAREWADRPLAHDIGPAPEVADRQVYQLPAAIVAGWPDVDHVPDLYGQRLGPRSDVVAVPADEPGHQHTGTC